MVAQPSASALLDRATRYALYESLDDAHSGDRAWSEFQRAGARMEGDSSEFRDLVAAIVIDGREDVLEVVVMNPRVPFASMLALAESGLAVMAIAHVNRGYEIARVLADKFGAREAVTTVAVTLYCSPQHSDEEFRRYLNRYADDDMVMYNLDVRQSEASSPAKRAILQPHLDAWLLDVEQDDGGPDD
ncbi:hypothetical protein N1027_16375 [Herbiconiux sp. CPCC 205763]|uniref:Uncharacterized protein n=1 Tax=Herbiconiux aconitum TaxID=2970913 RepID=A0ABT2GU37_9MICO|nr:hypothetical protein [Herbiconiux aconitum]MCS5719710.1 hypothetical protein [Herbiconiux aconitum]